MSSCSPTSSHPVYVPKSDLERHLMASAEPDGLITQKSAYDSMVRMGVNPCLADYVARAQMQGWYAAHNCQPLHVSDALKLRDNMGMNVWDAKGKVDRKALHAMVLEADTNKDGVLSYQEISDEALKLVAARHNTTVANLTLAQQFEAGPDQFGFELNIAIGLADAWAFDNGRPVQAISERALLSFYNGRFFKEKKNTYRSNEPAEASLPTSCGDVAIIAGTWKLSQLYGFIPAPTCSAPPAAAPPAAATPAKNP